MNCIGGVLAHDLGIRFNSPTVNLYMRAEDFIRFCENLDDYLAIDEMTPCTDAAIIDDRTYPVACLGDLVLFLVHYPSVEEANLKDGKVDIDSLEAIAFDPYTHGYYKVGGRVGEAFRDGLKLK